MIVDCTNIDLAEQLISGGGSNLAIVTALDGVGLPENRAKIDPLMWPLLQKSEVRPQVGTHLRERLADDLGREELPATCLFEERT